MNEKLIARLERFFDGLDRDLDHGLAIALAKKLDVSIAEIFQAYEAWQIK